MLALLRDGMTWPLRTRGGEPRMAPRAWAKWFEVFRADTPVEPFGPPVRTTPLPVEVDPDDTSSLVAAAQRWLDEVAGIGTAGEVVFDVEGELWVLAEDVDLNAELLVRVGDAGDGWCAHGILSNAPYLHSDDWSGRDVFDLAPLYHRRGPAARSGSLR